MNNNDNVWRIKQIAATILYRCFGNISIYTSHTGLVDMLVSYNDGTSLKFGVIVKKSVEVTNDEKEKLVQSIRNKVYQDERFHVPIIAMYVDEPAETAKVAFLVGWQFGEPRIYRNFDLRVLTPKTANLCLQIIKSMDEVIRLLSIDDLNVIKRICFSKKIGGARKKGEILYLRKMTTSYRMNPKTIVDEKERFERLVKGSPENEYPKDALDDLVFQAVKEKYRDASVHSSLLLYSTELKDIQLYKEMHCYHTSLVIMPRYSDISSEISSMLDGLDLFSTALDIYVEKGINENAFDDASFTKEEPLEGWIKKVLEWNTLKETMRPISAYFK